MREVHRSYVYILRLKLEAKASTLEGPIWMVLFLNQVYFFLRILEIFCERVRKILSEN